MFSLYGYEFAIRNIYQTAAAKLGDRAIEDRKELREFYLDALTELAPALPINRSPDKFVNCEEVELRLRSCYETSLLDDLNQGEVIGDAYSHHVKRQKITRAKETLQHLLSLCSELSAVFDVAVHTVFVRAAKERHGKRAHGGTTSLAPGVIWLAVHDDHSKQDLMELFLHELTHTLMFIDEFVHKQFDNAEIKKKHNYTPSAILRPARPLDKVVHSMVVGTEIVIARTSFLSNTSSLSVHPESSEIIDGVLRAYEGILSLQNHQAIITPHAFSIIDRCRSACRRLLPQAPIRDESEATCGKCD